MSNSNRGGARPGAGRPRVSIVKVPTKPDTKWLVLGMSEKFWQEFCDAASDTIGSLGDTVQESDYVRLAEIVLVDGMDKYIRGKKRADKRKAEKNEQQ